jgi:hypothetical protein
LFIIALDCESCEKAIKKLLDFKRDFVGKSSGNHSLDSHKSRESRDSRDTLWTSFHVNGCSLSNQFQISMPPFSLGLFDDMDLCD